MKDKQQYSNFRRNIKLGFGLVVIILLLLLANRFEENNLSQIDQSFESIYEDRLVPATFIFDIGECLYKKREILERSLHSPEMDLESAHTRIATSDQKIDSLLAAYKLTYFLDEETDHLIQFEDFLGQYNYYEGQILNKMKQGDPALASRIFEEEASIPFDRAISELSDLNHIQLEIGKVLMTDEKSAGASAKLLFRLETGLILLVALIVYIFARRSVFVDGNVFDRYHLN